MGASSKQVFTTSNLIFDIIVSLENLYTVNQFHIFFDSIKNIISNNMRMKL